MDASSAKLKEVDLEAYPTAKKFIGRCREFFGEIEDLWVIARNFH